MTFVPFLVKPYKLVTDEKHQDQIDRITPLEEEPFVRVIGSYVAQNSLYYICARHTGEMFEISREKLSEQYLYKGFIHD